MAMMMGNSGRGRRGRRRQMADINVTPMVDVMLVLLVVFMITAPMLATGVAVTLPKTAAEQLKQENERPLVVTVDNNLEKRVFVRGDEAVPYGAVVNVLALLQRAGFKNAGLPVDANAAQRILEQGG